jgi:hypothetical protein
MHYVIVAGIFGLPFAVCAAVLVAKVLDRFASEESAAAPLPDKSHFHDSESRVNDLVDTFLAAPVEPHPKR